jgi:hypothetical protein
LLWTLHDDKWILPLETPIRSEHAYVKENNEVESQSFTHMQWLLLGTRKYNECYARVPSTDLPYDIDFDISHKQQLPIIKQKMSYKCWQMTETFTIVKYSQFVYVYTNYLYK